MTCPEKPTSAVLDARRTAFTTKQKSDDDADWSTDSHGLSTRRVAGRQLEAFEDVAASGMYLARVNRTYLGGGTLHADLSTAQASAVAEAERQASLELNSLAL